MAARRKICQLRIHFISSEEVGQTKKIKSFEIRIQRKNCKLVPGCQNAALFKAEVSKQFQDKKNKN